MADDTANALADRELGDMSSRVVPLSEHDEFEIADGYPEVRGWDVRDSGGRSIGYVYDLLVDVAAMRVRFVDVLLDPEFAKSGAEQRVLIPIANVGLDGSTEGVLLRGIDATGVRALAPYARLGVPRAREAPLTVSKVEELVMGSPHVAATGVDIRKTVETKHVSKSVPVVREEVDVERRALRPGEVISAIETRGDETRIPIMAEEVIVEKRLVAKEVLIIRKRRVTEERTVETELRREQVHMDDPLGRVRTSDESNRPEGEV
jgi:photosynthetic reaction center H subunit